MSAARSGRALTVGGYLASRLRELGSRHVFGVPGDYSLYLCDCFIEKGFRWVGTCNELNAGYAADAYARLNGISAVCLTYGVGGFSALNAAAGARAEMVPAVYVVGAPRVQDYKPGGDSFPHHGLVGNLYAEHTAYKEVTVSSAILFDPAAAADTIDETLRQCVRDSMPVFLEVPMDVAAAECPGASERLLERPASSWDFSPPHDAAACTDAVAEVARLLLGARRPAILVGVEVQRRSCQPAVRRLARMLRVPVATTRHGKTSLEEGSAMCAGVYQGILSRDAVRAYVESADVLLVLGAAQADFDFMTAKLGEEGQLVVRADSGCVRVQGAKPSASAPVQERQHHSVALAPFANALGADLFERLGDSAARDVTALTSEGTWAAARAAALESVSIRRALGEPSTNGSGTSGSGAETEDPQAQVTVAGFIAAVGRWLHRQATPVTVLADAGDSLIAATDLTLRPSDYFLAQAFYLSIGYTVPAAVGAALATRERPRDWVSPIPGDFFRQHGSVRRTVVLVGDGAFQMTAQEVSTAVRHKLPITFIVLNNFGYSIEKAIHRGPPGENDYNEIQNWRYAQMARAFGQAEGDGVSAVVRTVEELQSAMDELDKPQYVDACNMLEVQFDPADYSHGLRTIGDIVQAKNKLSNE